MMPQKNDKKKISQTQGQSLVKLARNTILKTLGENPKKQLELSLKHDLEAPVFSQKRGTFITLHKNGKLRGCIGTLDTSETLREGVEKNAVNAAFHDPRFPELKKNELDEIDIEVSVLSEPIDLEYKDGEDLVLKLEPGIHGVIIQKGPSRATFLPQVWDQLPEPEIFLSHLCTKAGLNSQEWKKGKLEVMIYNVQYFKETAA